MIFFLLNQISSAVIIFSYFKSERCCNFMNLVLIGFMGTGKSTVAAYLSCQYGMEIVEMDEVLARQEGMSIPEIFQVHGEPYFRNLETELLKKLQNCQNKIISCGGGAALREENVKEMKKNGKVALLTASPETILDRTKTDTSRPLLKDRKTPESIASLMQQRQEKYLAAADFVISTDHKSVAEICEEIAKELQLS